MESALSITISKSKSSIMLSKDRRWQVGILSPLAGSSTYSIPYLQRTNPQYASASLSDSSTILSYILAALSNSLAIRKRFALSYSFIIFSSFIVGTVSLLPQYSHSQSELSLLMIFKSPPHFLHLNVGICILLEFPYFEILIDFFY